MSQSDSPIDLLYTHLWSFAEHRILTVASRLGVLRLLAEEKLTSAQVAERLHLDILATDKIMRALSAMKLLTADHTHYKVPSDLQAYFKSNHFDIHDFIEHMHDLYENWGRSLENWVRTGKHARRRRTLEGTHSFARAMRASAKLVAPSVFTKLRVFGSQSILDLGGGAGTYASCFCDLSSMVHITVVDKPEVVEYGEGLVQELPYQNRIRFIGQDYLEFKCPPQYDIVLLANVLHQEKPPAAKKLIRTAYNALVPGGRIAIVDFQIDEAKQNHLMGTLFAVNMRSFGDTYRESTIQHWLNTEGFKQNERFDLYASHWLIVGHKR